MKRHYSKPAYFLAFVVQLAAVAAFDYYTGYEVKIGALYAGPIAFATWYLGVWPGVAASFGATALILWLEEVGGTIYSAKWIAYSNSASWLVVFLFVTFSFSYFQRTIDLARKRVRAFEGKLPVCCCCHRVDGGDGFWIDFPTYVRTKSEAVPEFVTCPVCVREKREPMARKPE
jgi:hypothetical protein